MGDEGKDNFFSDPSTIFRKKRPVPIPIYDYPNDRYIERPYLRKNELSKIRDNLDELVDIKVAEIDKQINKLNIKSDNKPAVKPDDKSNIKLDDKPNEKKEEKIEQKTQQNDFKLKDSFVIETKKIDPLNIGTIGDSTSNATPNIPVQTESKKVLEEKPKEDIKLGIANLNQSLQSQQPQQTQQIDDNKKQKITKKKVIKRMNDEEYIPSAEERRRMRKAEMQEFHEEDKTKESIRKAAELAEQNQRDLAQNRRDLEKLRETLAAESDKTKLELKTEFGNKFNELGGKFNDITGRFEKVSGKLEDTCTGIDCLKKDLANMSKNFELTECPQCGEKIVPPLSSFCPGCAAQISGWIEDDGVTPIKGWKPNWKK